MSTWRINEDHPEQLALEADGPGVPNSDPFIFWRGYTSPRQGDFQDVEGGCREEDWDSLIELVNIGLQVQGLRPGEVLTFRG